MKRFYIAVGITILIIVSCFISTSKTENTIDDLTVFINEISEHIENDQYEKAITTFKNANKYWNKNRYSLRISIHFSDIKKEAVEFLSIEKIIKFNGEKDYILYELEKSKLRLNSIEKYSIIAE